MRRDRDHEAGFTVVELAIVMMISMTVMASIVGMLHSQSKAERSVSGLASAQEQVRLALVAVQSDLRSAEPLVALPTASEFPKRMEIIHLDFDTDAMLRFRWRLDDVNDELVRETLDASGNVTGTTFRLGGVTNNTVFRYFNSRGEELTAENSTSEIIASCTLRVRVLIDAAPENGPQPLDNWSDVQLRNRLPGGVGC
jgi:type II secretory pathway pseudopilin PulG